MKAIESSKVALIVNGRSRTGRDSYRLIEQLLEEREISVSYSFLCQKQGDIEGAVQKALNINCETIILGGGDGTISAASSLLSNSEIVLVVLPLGTGNSFARDLEIPLELESWVKMLADGELKKVDLSRCGTRQFVNVATIGLTTKIAEALDGNQKKALGRAAYISAVWRSLFKLRKFHVRVILDDRSVVSASTLQVVIGNGRSHAGPFPVGPTASLTDGNLNGYIVVGASIWSLIKVALRLPGGKLFGLNEVQAFSSRTCRIETNPKRRVTVDGEVVERTPLDFECLPGALTCLVPRSESE